MSVNEIKFSDICGENVELSEDNSFATWNPKNSGGWACCDQEFTPGEIIEVNVEGSGRCDIGFMKEEQGSRSFRTLNEIRVHRKSCRIQVTFSGTGTEIASVYNDTPFKREIKKGTKIWIAIFIRFGCINVEFLSNDFSEVRRSPKFSSNKHGPNILLENDNTKASSVRKSPASICCISKKLQTGDKIKLECSPEEEGGRGINRYELKLQVSQICPEDLKKEFKFLFEASEVITTDVPLTTVECIDKDECNGNILVTLTSGKAIQYTTARSKQNTQPLNFDVENGVWIVLEIYGLKVRVSSETSETTSNIKIGMDQPDSLSAGHTRPVTEARLDVENNSTHGSGEYESKPNPIQESQPNASPRPVSAAASASGRECEDRPNLKTNFPFLVREIDTMPFCDHFFAKSIITESQMDEIHTIVRSKGRSEANRELIKMISRKNIKRSVMEEIAKEAHQSHLIEMFYPTENR